MQKVQIAKCCAREILDSRGDPTVEATVILCDGTVGVASVPSGASTGIYEAHELRDKDSNRYGGKGVLDAVTNVCKVISPSICGISVCEQSEIDKILIELDGSENRSLLGANAMLSVSLACVRAAANFYHMPIYKYIGGINAKRLPTPFFNILNGGVHASNNVEIQEFMIVPTGASSFSEALRMGSEIYHTLGKILKKENKSTAVGDEGGYAPELSSDEEAISYICRAIEESGYNSELVSVALDCASGEWFSDGEYIQRKSGRKMTSEELICYYEELCSRYPIISIEDGLDVRDTDGWERLTKRLGGKIMLVGDDLFVTSPERFRKGIDLGIANSVLVKPNQIGTLSEVLKVIRLANEHGYSYILSHRSGETEDTTIADIAVGTNAPYIKSGAPCRSERIAKYNRLLRIESCLNLGACFGETFC